MVFPSCRDYELLVYTLPQRYPEIALSSLRLFTTSSGTAIVKGSVVFRAGVELRVFEVLDFTAGRISDYSYNIFWGGELIRWYDPQPHPELPDLAHTFPHHRHEPPNIKHNRRPAPGIGFQSLNLPVLVADCIELGRNLPSQETQANPIS